MKVVRTIVWVLLLVAFVAFSVANWDEQVDVQIWDNLIWDTKLPAVVVVAFLVGLAPVWLMHLATKWHYRRRIASLENAARMAATTPAPSPAAVEPDPIPPVP